MAFQIPFSSIAKKYNGKLNNFSPFAKKRDSILSSDVIQRGEKVLSIDYPSIRATDFMAFVRTGNRSAYEKAYFARRHLLNKLVLAEYFEGNGRFLDKIIDGIWMICEESSWCLPAHNSYVRDTPQLILPEIQKPVLDLFACETGEILAMTLYLLRDSLQNVSAIIENRICTELYGRIIAPYLNEHFWWMGNGDEPMCNWTPWCTQNVLLTAFLLPELTSYEEREKIFHKAAASCDFFLKDYGIDGCCEEGAHYYRHAGLCLFGTMEILNAITNNAFACLYEEEKIKNMASYICNIHAVGPYYFNYADCAAKAGRAGVREYFFGKATKQQTLMEFAAKDCAYIYKNNRVFEDESVELNLYVQTLTVLGLEEVLAFSPADTVSELASEIYYPSVGIWIVKDPHFALSVKTGDNDDSHNHNDAGSFILYKDGQPIFIDVGVETYTAKTFSKDRYDIWTMQSCYHNLPTIDGRKEEAGAEYRVSNVTIGDYGGKKTVSMHLETAYSNLAHSYVRTICFDSAQKAVSLVDETLAEDVLLNFITYEKPIIKDGAMMIGNALVHFTGADLPHLEEIPITDARLKETWEHNIYRLQFLTNGRFEMNVF